MMNKVLRKILKYNIKLPLMLYYRIRDSKRKPKKSIALIGFLGAFNLGDEMMLETTLEHLRHNKKVGDITIFTCEPKSSQINRYDGCRIIPRSPLTKEAIQYSAKHNDVLFVNGGALLDDRWYDDSKSLAHDIVRLAKEFIENKKKVVFYGVSCNESLSNQKAMDDFVYVINNSAYFSVRDTFTMETLGKLKGVNEENIRLVDDIVFANKGILCKKWKERPIRDGDIRVGVVPVLNSETREYYKTILKSLKSNNDDIEIISFYNYNDEELREIINIKNEIGLKNITLDNIVFPSTIEELTRVIANVDVLVSSRYHCTLVANCIGVPTICLNYDQCPHYNTKNKYLYKDYGFKGKIINLSEFADGCRADKIINESQSSNVNTRKIFKKADKELLEAIRFALS